MRFFPIKFTLLLFGLFSHHLGYGAQDPFEGSLPIFYKISQAGHAEPSGYIIGTKHDECINAMSLPPEIQSALNRAGIGLFEIVTSDREQIGMAQILRKMFFLPEGEELSHYMGEEKTREIFAFFRPLFDRHAGAIQDVFEALSIDLISYSDFNRMSPEGLMALLKKLLQKKNNPPPDTDTAAKPAGETEDATDFADKTPSSKDEGSTVGRDGPLPSDCLEEGKMDVFIEKYFSCLGRPVLSLETLEQQTSSLTPYSTQKTQLFANIRLRPFFDGIRGKNAEAGFYEDYHTAMDIINEQLIESGISQLLFQEDPEPGIEAATNQFRHFLKEKQCSNLPEDHIIKSHIDILFAIAQTLNQTLAQQSSENPLSLEQKANLRALSDDNIELSMNIFSSCFPNLKMREYYDNMIRAFDPLEEAFAIQEALYETLIDRDMKMAQNIAPFLEEGGIFIAVGSAHLSGIIRNLKDNFGFSVQAVPLSHPVRPLDPDSCEP